MPTALLCSLHLPSFTSLSSSTPILYLLTSLILTRCVCVCVIRARVCRIVS